MNSHGSVARLTDIIEAIGLIRLETEAISIGAFAVDRRKQWVVERGPAGMGNILRRDYQRVAYYVIWRVLQHDLPDRWTAGLIPDASAGLGR